MRLVITLLLTAGLLPSQTFTVIVNFSGLNGAEPNAPLVQGVDGHLYGATHYGGASPNCSSGCGTVFKVSVTGKLTALHSFSDMPDGSLPLGGLVQTSNRYFYGTTSEGGSDGEGAIFKITPSGLVTIAHNFFVNDGSYPTGQLLQAKNFFLYGTTQFGGTANSGTVFEITLSDIFTSMASFSYPNGVYPNGGVAVDNNGNVFGTTLQGGTNGLPELGFGTAFKITPAGTLTTVHDFDNSTDGAHPAGSLLFASDGKFYGVAQPGAFFSIAPNGAFSVLDSTAPYVQNLIQATDGNIYASAGDSIYEYVGGAWVTLYSDNGSQASFGNGLLQATDGNFYGVSSNGGTTGDGFIFKLSTGLAPFLKTLPTFGVLARALPFWEMT